MNGVNKAIIVGTLGNDPETRYANNGSAITNISVATSEKWKDKTSGEMQEKTEWHRICAFGKLAEIMSEYLRKGSQVYIEGRIETTKYQDNNGVDKYSTQIIANQMQMLGGRNNEDNGHSQAYESRNAMSEKATPISDKPNTGFDDQTIPF